MEVVGSRSRRDFGCSVNQPNSGEFGYEREIGRTLLSSATTDTRKAIFMSSSSERSGHGQHRIDDQLVARIRERLDQGLSPPPEIYQVQYRDKIDWSQLPEWALPLDPDVFEGCSHEG